MSSYCLKFREKADSKNRGLQRQKNGRVMVS